MTNNEELTFTDPRCPKCGSDDEIVYLICNCCAQCENCGHEFMIEN